MAPRPLEHTRGSPQPLERTVGGSTPLGRPPTLLLTVGILPSNSRLKTRTQTCLSQLCLMQANNDINSLNQRHLTWPSAQESCHEKRALTCRPRVGSGPESQGWRGREHPEEGAAGSASAGKQQPHHRPRPPRQALGPALRPSARRHAHQQSARTHLPQLTPSLLN